MRLSIVESHTYIEQALQQQGAFKKDKQFHQAVDFAINKAVHKFVRSCLKPIPNTSKFEINETNREDIQSLIVSNYPITFIQKMDGGRYFSTSLPSDFKYLINDKTYTIEDCESQFTDSVENKTKKYTYIELIDINPDNSGKYYKQIVLNVGASNTTIVHSGFTSARDKYYLIDIIIKEFKSLGIDAYWERAEGIYKRNNFVIPSLDLTKIYSVIIDGTTLTSTDSARSFTDIIKTNLTSTNLVPNRNVKNDDIDNIEKSYYDRPRITSPVSILASDKLEVYSDKKFLVYKVLIDYIMQPQSVNLSLNYGFNLHESTHDRICDLAVEIIKEQIESKTLGKTVEFNQVKNNS